MITSIIPAHNEERLLPRTITALRTAARGVNESYEIIVVDDASMDATAAMAQGLVSTGAFRYMDGRWHACDCGCNDSVTSHLDASSSALARLSRRLVASMRACTLPRTWY